MPYRDIKVKKGFGPFGFYLRLSPPQGMAGFFRVKKTVLFDLEMLIQRRAV